MTDSLSTPVFAKDSAKLNQYTYRLILYYDFYTTLTALHNFHIPNSSEPNNAYLYYNLDIKNSFTLLHVTWDCYLFNDYGLRHFFDSITLKTQDQFNFKNSFSYPIWKNQFKLAVQSNTRTPLFKTYQIRTNTTGEPERYLYESFMSPGTITYSGGVTYEFKQQGSLHLGLGSSKITKIRNQEIFESRQTELISGITKGARKKQELGIVFTATIPLKKFSKRWYWEFYGNWFSPLNQLNHLKNQTLDVNNVFHLTLLKYVRLSYRCKIQYHPEESKNLGLMNQLSLGFYLNNHL
jgi:hypothetical protein